MKIAIKLLKNISRVKRVTMEENQSNEEYLVIPLQWDTNHFGINCAQVILYQPLSESSWQQVRTSFSEFEFITIKNLNSEPHNAQLLGQYTSSFLADVNIQFSKKTICRSQLSQNIAIQNNLEQNKEIVSLAIFEKSRFIEDPRLLSRGGSTTYHQWVMNSFGRIDKYFAISRDKFSKVNGFLLFSFSGCECTVELMAVSREQQKNGIGTELLMAVEHYANAQEFDCLKVGTQIRNLPAINFYSQYGFKQIACHQIYHLWNL